MGLKGSMKLELTDIHTGEKMMIRKENMLTNAINDILGMNLMGALFHCSNDGDHINWDEILPICPNLIGGILIFSKPLEARADNIFPPADNHPYAYASNNVNGTTDLMRGSLNQTESKALTNGYQFVWDFTAAQGNGTIAALALTSARGGISVYGNIIDDSSFLLPVKTANLASLTLAQKTTLMRIAEVDFANNCFYSISVSGYTVTITKGRMPALSIGLNDTVNCQKWQVLETKTLACKSFHEIEDILVNYALFLDGKDGYWYGFANSPSSAEAENAYLSWIKISKTDYTFTEGSWTFSGVKMQEVGSQRIESENCERHTKSCIRSGYLYVMSYDKKGVYKIKVSYSDPWCATMVSAVAIKCGCIDIIPVECGCDEMIRRFQEIGEWVEDDNHIPQPGEIIFYDWNDSGEGDDQGSAEHVGIVSAVSDNFITVIEGNKSDAVATRKIVVGGKYIRGYGVPRYQESCLDVAKEVIAGKWGNGSERVERLRAAGYDPDQVQEKVNALMRPSIDQVAREVIQGRWGNGDARVERLEKAGYDPIQVQRRVNEIMG